MAFRFRLQAALDRLYAREAEARSIVVDARMAYDAGTSRRSEIASAIAEHRACRAALVRSGDPAFAASEASIVALDALGGRLERRLVAFSASLARARDLYAEAGRRRLALERLRDRRREEHALRRERRETAELDEANAFLARVPLAEFARDEAPARDRSKSYGVITLHRLNGQPLIVNADLIETVEHTDDGETAIVLTTGTLLTVIEPPDAVRAAALAFRRSIVAPGP